MLLDILNNAKTVGQEELTLPIRRFYPKLLPPDFRHLISRIRYCGSQRIILHLPA